MVGSLGDTLETLQGPVMCLSPMDTVGTVV